MRNYKLVVLFSIFVFVLASSSHSSEFLNVSEKNLPKFMAIAATKNGTFDLFTDIEKLNENFIGEGIYSFAIASEYGTEYYVVGGSGVTGKVDEDLYNKSFLKSEGYLTEDEKVPVIISLNTEQVPQKESASQLVETESVSQLIETVAPEEETKKSFEIAKNEVNSVLEKASEGKGEIKKDLEIINAISAEVPLEKIDEIASSDAVKKIHLDRKVELVLQDSVPLINANAIWRMLDSNGQNVTGKNITIAIIDTGIDYTHPDLGGCLGTNCKVIGGYDFVNSDNDPMDDHGHGTHVAATAASNGTLKGVAPDAKLYGYKVLSSGGWGYFSWVISGVQRATDPNNDGNYADHADILSMSLGGYGDDDDPLAQAVDTAVDRGVVSVVAAGNSGSSTNAIGTPAAARKAITVGATDKNDVIAYFSSRGPSPKNNIKPDLTAPGVSICAAQWDGWLSDRRCYDNQHISISGTSMATPHVSGAAALLLQLHRNWTPPMVKSALMLTTKDLGYDVFTQGTGRINVSKAASSLIATYPQGISFGQVADTNLIANITIQNLNGTSLTLNVTAGLMKNSTGQTVNISYIINSSGHNISSFTISSNQNISINLSINIGNLEGTYYGYINISYGNDIYRIPYAFTRLSKLTVRILDQNNGNTLRPYAIAVHNNDLMYKKYVSQWWDFYGNSHDFYIPSGSYQVHATGDASNSSLYYILSRNVSVPLAGTVELNISLNDARPFNVTAYSLGNSSLDLNKWYFILDERHTGWTGWGDSRMFGMGVAYLGFGFSGDRIIYISNTDNESSVVNSNISLSYIGFPQRNNTYNEYSWQWGDETLATTNELYAMGWMLYKVNSTTDTVLNYTINQLAIYNYTYDYPGIDPHQGATYPSYTYSGIYFWESPASWFDISTFYPYTIPLNRTAYVKDGNGWGWYHFILINYLHADILGSTENEIIASFNQKEHATREVPSWIWPRGIWVETSHRLNFYHGRAPYLPTSFSNQNTLINISKYLLKGFTNETYMEKWIQWARPVISIYDSTGSLVSNSTTYWQTFYNWYSNNQYTVNISIPSAYPLSNMTLITAKFNLSFADKNPPALTQINMIPRFEYNRYLPLSFGISDDYGISNVSIYYSLNQGSWAQLPLTNTSNNFNTTINVTDSSATELNLKIFANDTSGNQINYTIMPIAILARNVSLNFTADKLNANQGDTILFKGRVIDTTNNKYISGARIVYYLDGAEYGVDRSEPNSSWPYVYDSKRGRHTLNEGEFEAIWVIPSNYQSDTATFSAVFNGTGVYLPNTTSIQITINVTAPKYSNVIRYPSYPTINDNVTINSTWTDVHTVLFESNYTGTPQNYTTTNISSTYSFTILSPNLTIGKVVGYRFIANNSANAWNMTMPIQTFNVSGIPLNITPVTISYFDNNKGWGENWTFKCNTSDSEGDVVTARLWTKSPTGDWESKGTNSTTGGVNVTHQLTFVVNLSNSYVGSSQIKCNVTDTTGVMNESSIQSITVDKDDVNVTVTSGSNQAVQRYGASTISLAVTVYDFDRQQYVNTPSGEIYYTKDSATPYDAVISCVGNSIGNCSVSLDPDDTFTVGTQYFLGGTTPSDAYYKAANSSQANFTVLGTLNVLSDSPSGAFDITDMIYFNASVFDEFYKSITADDVKLEYKKSIGTAEWTSCTPVNETASAKYFCALNASTAGLTIGFYDIKYSATKANYTSSNVTHNRRFLILQTIRFSQKANFTANVLHKINATNINASIEIKPNATVNNSDVNVTFNSSNPVNVNFGVLEIGRYLTLNVSSELAGNLSYAIIKVNYTENDINQTGVVEESLRLYRFNGTTWVPYNNQSSDYQGGVNTVDNYVWGNVTRFSEFGVGGKRDNGQSCSSNDECNSGHCASDYDGEGKWCAASGYCAHDYNVTYTNGYTLCSDSSTKQTCSSGNWASQACSYGCSNGACNAAPTTGVTITGGGIGGEVVTPAKEVVESLKVLHSLENLKSKAYIDYLLKSNNELFLSVATIVEGLTEKKIEEIAETTSETMNYLTPVERTIEVSKSKSTLSVSFSYLGKENMKRLILYDIIPKSFANTSDDITVNAPGASVTIVRKDPVYLIHYSPLYPNQKIQVNYSVNKKLNTSVVNDVQPPIILVEAIKPEEKPPCAQDITYAINPLTKICKTFPTPCDVPTDWTVVEKCPSIVEGKKLPAFLGFVIGFTIALVVLQSLRMYEKIRKKKKPEVHKKHKERVAHKSETTEWRFEE